MNPLYLDHNASTPPDPAVVEAMLPWLGAAHANPHSEHIAGRKAAAAIDTALSQIASLIGVDASDIVLTSGATESNNLALQGMLTPVGLGARSLYHSSIEHKSVLEVASYLSTIGVKTFELPVDRKGRIECELLKDAIIQPAIDRLVVSVMHGNNEVGTVQDIPKLSQLLCGTGGFLHVDATQTAGRVALSAETFGIDLLSLSSHKLYGPAGIGALYVSPNARNFLRPLLHGGGQQAGLRPGTVPVFLAVGFGMACQLAEQRLADDATALEVLADGFCERLRALGIAFDVLGDPDSHLPGLRSIKIADLDGDDLVARVSPSISISTGSACTAGELRSSHVLRSIGLSDEEARGVIRIGFGRNTTTTDAGLGAEVIAAAIRSAQR